MGTESRAARRLTIRGRFIGASTGVLHGELNDISATGLSLTTDIDVPSGQALHLEFELPTGAVQLVAEARWSKRDRGGYELGLAIVRIAEPSRVVLERALARGLE